MIRRTPGASGLVRRKHRSAFERFLTHPHERVRAYASAVAASDASRREMFRQERLAEDEFDVVAALADLWDRERTELLRALQHEDEASDRRGATG